MPNTILNKFSVHSGRDERCELMSSGDVWPNTAKNSRSNAMIGVIGTGTGRDLERGVGCAG